MSWVDTAVLAAVVLSCAVAFSRGFAREILGIGAWVGAFFFASATASYVRPTMRGWLGNPDIADPASYAVVFLGGLIVLSVLTGMIGSAVRQSLFGSVDRTLGVLFGMVRAVVLLAFVYVGLGFVVPTERWPLAAQEARSIPYIYMVAIWMSQFLSPDYRPHIPAPPAGRETHAADLLHATPQGRATARP